MFQVRSIQSTPSDPIFLRSIPILCYHLCVGLPSGLFPSCIPSIIFLKYFSSHPSHPPWLDHSKKTFVLWKWQYLKIDSWVRKEIHKCDERGWKQLAESHTYILHKKWWQNSYIMKWGRQAFLPSVFLMTFKMK